VKEVSITNIQNVLKERKKFLKDRLKREANVLPYTEPTPENVDNEFNELKKVMRESRLYNFDKLLTFFQLFDQEKKEIIAMKPPVVPNKTTKPPVVRFKEMEPPVVPSRMTKPKTDNTNNNIQNTNNQKTNNQKTNNQNTNNQKTNNQNTNNQNDKNQNTDNQNDKNQSLLGKKIKKKNQIN